MSQDEVVDALKGGAVAELNFTIVASLQRTSPRSTWLGPDGMHRTFRQPFLPNRKPSSCSSAQMRCSAWRLWATSLSLISGKSMALILPTPARITGSSSAVLVISNVAPTDTAAYSVIVTNAFGSVTSAGAALNVQLVQDGGFETGDFTGWTPPEVAVTSCCFGKRARPQKSASRASAVFTGEAAGAPARPIESGSAGIVSREGLLVIPREPPGRMFPCLLGVAHARR